jgi:urease accessory protein
MLRAHAYVRANFRTETPWDVVVLEASERHLRRKRLVLQHGDAVLVDLPKPVRLDDRDCLVLEDGRLVEVIAAEEDLLEITARNPAALVQLAWHIGNRHLEAQIEQSRLLIRPDHVIAHMLEHQGATVRSVREPFSPENGAYHEHGTGSHEH